MTLETFIDKHVAARESDDHSSGYLAQHRLFDQIPRLRSDILVPDYCSLRESSRSADDDGDNADDTVDINAWFGPARTISSLHHDPKHNLLCQVVGRKYVRLYEAKYSSDLYPRQGVLSNTSSVDVEGDPSVTRRSFPRFASVPYKECVLEPGDALYIPAGMWHYVRSLTKSFSVSFWWK
eukprot:g2982.t1